MFTLNWQMKKLRLRGYIILIDHLVFVNVLSMLYGSSQLVLSMIFWGRRQWHPTPVLLPEKSHGPRSLEGCSPWGHWGSDTTDFTFTFHFHALEKEMATHSRVLAWRIPGTGEPDGLPSMGSHRVGHDWSDLAAAAKDKYQGAWALNHTTRVCLVFWGAAKLSSKVAAPFCILTGNE